MTTADINKRIAGSELTDSELTDPRKVRSRNRLLDAAASLLAGGGIDAVTIDAVTKASKVARTTLYRHFDSSTHLLAATFERLLPPVTRPPTTGPLRERLIELLYSQATRIQEAPQLTPLAWLALGPGRTAGGEQGRSALALGALRNQVIEQYRQPFDEILGTPDIAEELGEFDLTLALLQLVGPIVLAKLSGLVTIGREDCTRIVDDFLAARRSGS